YPGQRATGARGAHAQDDRPPSAERDEARDVYRHRRGLVRGDGGLAEWLRALLDAKGIEPIAERVFPREQRREEIGAGDPQLAVVDDDGIFVAGGRSRRRWLGARRRRFGRRRRDRGRLPRGRPRVRQGRAGGYIPA